MNWRTDPNRACASADVHPDEFFPDGIDRNEHAAEPAKRICGHCPVVFDCLKYALDTGQDFGVWGWTTPKERREIGKVGLAVWLRRRRGVAA